MPKAIFIWELPKTEKLKYYKRIKNALVTENEYTYEKLVECMSSKIVDLPYELM